MSSMRGSRKFFSDGVQLFFLFILVKEWIQISLESGHHRPASETPFIGPPAKRHLNGVSLTPFKWRFAGVPMMAQH